MANPQTLQEIGERILRKRTLQLVKPSTRRVLGVRPEGSAQVEAAKPECQTCGGVGYTIVERYRPVRETEDCTYIVICSAAKECECKRTTRIRAFYQSIPPEFRECNLATLEARPDKHPAQVEIVEDVKAHPLESYLFCGRNRAGKSHIGWCITVSSYLAGFRVVQCNLSALLDEYRATEKPVGEGEPVPPRPRVMSSDLEVENVRYCLFIQEFDKPRPTAYAAEKLFDLIDTAYNNHHQLIVTSNLSVAALTAHWSEHGARYGMGIVSRLVERCNEVNLF